MNRYRQTIVDCFLLFTAACLAIGLVFIWQASRTHYRYEEWSGRIGKEDIGDQWLGGHFSGFTAARIGRVESHHGPFGGTTIYYFVEPDSTAEARTSAIKPQSSNPNPDPPLRYWPAWFPPPDAQKGFWTDHTGRTTRMFQNEVGKVFLLVSG